MYQAREPEPRTVLDIAGGKWGSRYRHNDICSRIGIIEWILWWFRMCGCVSSWGSIAVRLCNILWCHDSSRLLCGRANAGVVALDQTRDIHRIVALNAARNIGILFWPAPPGLAALYVRNHRHFVGIAFLGHKILLFVDCGGSDGLFRQ